MKKIFFLLTRIVIIATIAAIVGEAALRIADFFDRNRGLRNSMGSLDRKYSHSFVPNSRFRLISSRRGEYNVAVHVNNYGFRGRDISIEKMPGTVRIMAMGDSFTFGVGAEEDQTIPFLIEKDLRANGVNAEVINAGFGNYSTILHYLKLRDEYIEFKPDIVFLFFDFSDLADDWRGEKNLIYDRSTGKILGCNPEFINGKRDWWITMRAHSRLCSFIHNKFIRLIDKIRILGFRNYVKAKLEGKRAKALITGMVALSEKVKDPIEYDGYIMIRGRDRLPYILEHFKRTEKYLGYIKEMLYANNIPLILVIYPYGIHVGPDQWEAGRQYWGFEKGKTYNDYYAFDILEDYAKRNRIPCINLLPDFLENSQKRLFFDVDGHFTPEANRIAAKSITDNPDFMLILKEARDKP